MSGAEGYLHLFSPLKIGNLELRNRIAMSPMGVAIIDDGRMSETAIRYYEERARGGVGLIITEPCAVAYPRGAQSARQPGVSDDRFVSGLRELTDRVHRHGAAIAIQLVHHGKVSRLDTREGRELLMPSIPSVHGAMDLANDLTDEERRLLIAASRGKPKVRPATRADIEWVVGVFADAVERALDAGFDAVELHAAHGYLISEFLSPAWNHRDDEYGGSIENRARLLCEVIAAAKRRAGAEFPVWCRLDAIELRTPGGIAPADAQRHAELAVNAGADAIHVSAYADATSGPAFTEAPLVHRESGYLDYAGDIKRRVNVPIIAVGRIEPEVAEASIRDGKLDIVAMGRKMLADPEIAAKLRDDREDDVRPCIYCYVCVAQPFFDRTVRCGVNPAMANESEIVAPTTPAEVTKSVLVIGGGPAGLEAARVAALRGHRVQLLERSPQLGGRWRYASALYEPNGRLLRWLIYQTERADIEIELGVSATVEMIRDRNPDAVIVATGGRSSETDVSADQLAQTLDGFDPAVILSPDLRAPADAIGQRVAVIGGSHVGIRIASLMARQGRSVTVLEPGRYLAESMAHPLRWRVLDDLRESGAKLHTRANIEKVSPTSVRFETRSRENPLREDLTVDTIIEVGNLTPNNELGTALNDSGIEAIAIGDADGGTSIDKAIHDGYRAGIDL